MPKANLIDRTFRFTLDEADKLKVAFAFEYTGHLLDLLERGERPEPLAIEQHRAHLRAAQEALDRASVSLTV